MITEMSSQNLRTPPLKLRACGIHLLLTFEFSPVSLCFSPQPSAMQEDALKLVLLALEDGSALSRKVLVLFVVQKLEARFPQASKTSIGHVVQLLYRASCFKVPADHPYSPDAKLVKHDQQQTGSF